jgi:beta-lactamase regulating signal transducer with metallopeptidase domain
MSDLLSWFSPALVRLVAWALLHFLWQGLVLAALFAGLMATFRTATTRYALAVSILVLMIAAPIATFLFLRQSSNLRPSEATSLVMTTAPEAARPVQADSPRVVSDEGISADTYVWLLRVWIAGVIFFTLRTAGGMLMVEWLQRRKAAPVAPRLLKTCLELQRMVGITRAIRFCECNGLDVPAVIGWFRPVVLLPMTVLTGLSHAQVEAVIVHELAHIKRWDHFVNLFQIVAETLLFYHPAVWWVSRSIRLERENCCDDMAVRLCGNVVDYARALTYMEGGRTAPTLVMAASGSPLTARVVRLLGTRKPGGNFVNAGLMIGVVCLGGGVFMSHALVQAAHADAKQAPAPAVISIANGVPKGTVHPLQGELATEPTVRPFVQVAELATGIPTTAAAIAQATTESSPAPVTQATNADQPANQGSYIDSLKAVGLNNLSIDTLIAMKIQGVTADYVREVRDLGLHPDPDELIAMRIQGVTAAYIRDMRASGMTGDADEFVAMKIQGVTPEYIRSIHELGLKPDADELVAMRIQRVTPDYIRDIRALGLNPTADELISMQVQGVTPAYIKALSAAGVAKSDADEYVGAKVLGITPEFIDKARQHGFQNLTLEQLITLKNAGVL